MVSVMVVGEVDSGERCALCEGERVIVCRDGGLEVEVVCECTSAGALG